MNEIFKDIIYLALVFVLVYVGFYLGTRHDTIEQKTARYDCNLTEFLAQTPEDVRNHCRQLKLNTINNQKD